MVRKKTTTQKDLSVIPSEFEGEEHSEESKHFIEENSAIQEESDSNALDGSRELLTGSAVKPVLPATQLVSGRYQ